MRPDEAIYIPWLVWYLSWVIAARWSNATVKRPSMAGQILVYLFEIGGFFTLLVLAGGAGDGIVAIRLLQPLWTLPDAAKWAMVGVATAGFSFCWWARIHLGRLWSGFITRKEGHRVVDTGPYRIVRHPIYTGVLIAALATVLVRASWISIGGFVLLLIGFSIKGKIEERFLRNELGTAAYDAYARKTAMLIPFAKI
jgi:protein-S-isoprenylcysteine O-methyltransferase Ste14